MELLNSPEVGQLIDRAIAEDLGWGDVTTQALIPDDQHGSATVIAKATGIVAGTELARQVLLKIDPRLTVAILIKDGTAIRPGDRIATIKGGVASILKAERLVLNFLQHLSGIASGTARYIEAVAGLNVRVTDTRKTLPGLRALQKYAVRAGGGKNHRKHLGDGILIKDNHLAALRSRGLGIKEILAKARQGAPPGIEIEIEVKNLEEAAEAAVGGADIIMLDNMSLEDMRKAVQLIAGRARVEASGGITLENIRAVAEMGLDLISVGALTHSSKALDISLELD